MPISDEDSVAWGRKFTSGKECYPCIITTGDILRQIRAGIWTLGGDGRLVYANPTAEALLQFRAADLRDQPILARVDAICPPLGQAIRRAAQDGLRVSRTEAEARVEGRVWPSCAARRIAWPSGGQMASTRARIGWSRRSAARNWSSASAVGLA